MHYSKKSKVCTPLQDTVLPTTNDDTVWVHVTSKSTSKLDPILHQLHIHPIAQNAISTFSHSPRLDNYQHHLFVSTFILKGYDEMVRVSILVGENYVISHEEENSLQVFSFIEEDFTDHPEHMKSTGHILYHILDQSNKFYLESVDKISIEIQKLEKSVFKKPFANEIGHNVYNWKERIHKMRNVVEAEETVIKELQQAENKYVDQDSGIYLQSLENNFKRVVDALDSYINTLSGIFDLQMSLKSDHMNTIMKALTIVSVIFIPMTFIAGLYGMNFSIMPELNWKYGYFYALSLMFILGVSIALYFRYKGWWGKSN